MKLGILPGPGGTDGLVVVNDDVTLCSDARHVAPDLLAAMRNWDRVAPELDLIARGLESGSQPVRRFHEREALALLPQPPLWIAPPDHPTPGVNASFQAPRGLVPQDTVAVEVGLALILGDLPQHSSLAQAAAAIRLVALFAHLFGPAGYIASRLSPVAVSPDALGWAGGQMAAAVRVEHASRRDVYEIAPADLASLVSAATGTAPIQAGSLVGAPALTGPLDLDATGAPLRLEMADARFHSALGAIELQTAAA
ncbi:MAG: hypothetical protein U1E34_02675 [Amaricoccus sp.]